MRYGGLSGPSLIPYTTRIVKYIKNHYPDTIVIAGGGVRNIEQAKNYENIGADHISVSTLFFNPILSWIFLKKYL